MEYSGVSHNITLEEFRMIVKPLIKNLEVFENDVDEMLAKIDYYDHNNGLFHGFEYQNDKIFKDFVIDKAKIVCFRCPGGETAANETFNKYFESGVSQRLILVIVL